MISIWLCFRFFSGLMIRFLSRSVWWSSLTSSLFHLFLFIGVWSIEILWSQKLRYSRITWTKNRYHIWYGQLLPMVIFILVSDHYLIHSIFQNEFAQMILCIFMVIRDRLIYFLMENLCLIFLRLWIWSVSLFTEHCSDERLY